MQPFISHGTTPAIVATIGERVMESASRAVRLGADAIELRLDMMDRGEDLHEILSRLRDRFNIPIIITNRMAEEGGNWRGSEDERVNVLRSLLPLADVVDIELRAPQRETVISEARRLEKTVIVSAHDFKRTPPPAELKRILEEEQAVGGDISKLAVTPQRPRDVLNLLEAGLNASFPVCIIAMGDLGRHTRVIASLYGSRLTYASVDEAMAPGQLRIDRVREIMKTIL